jgi:sugar/nucleoside kinase (ribokinase family)
MDSLPLTRYIVAGQLRREYIITPKGRVKVDIPGGNVLYSAVGLANWDHSIGLICKAGINFPAEDFEIIKKHGFDIRGIQISDHELDQRIFYGYDVGDNKANANNPVSYFASLAIEFPKSLLGYSPATAVSSFQSKKITPYTITLNEIPEDFWEASAAHICPLDFQSHQFIMSAVRQAHFNHITLDISSEYLSPPFWDDIPGMIEGANALLTTEDKLLKLYQGRSKDVLEIAESLASYNCPFIIIKRGMQGQYIYDHVSNKKWSLPAYPSTTADPTGAGDAFNGGFLAGLRTTYDPLEAALKGNISASLAVEGSGAFYALDGLPGLAQARLDNLRGMIRKL